MVSFWFVIGVMWYLHKLIPHTTVKCKKLKILISYNNKMLFQVYKFEIVHYILASFYGRGNIKVLVKDCPFRPVAAAGRIILFFEYFYRKTRNLKVCGTFRGWNRVFYGSHLVVGRPYIIYIQTRNSRVDWASQLEQLRWRRLGLPASFPVEPIWVNLILFSNVFFARKKGPELFFSKRVVFPETPLFFFARVREKNP